LNQIKLNLICIFEINKNIKKSQRIGLRQIIKLKENEKNAFFKEFAFKNYI